MSLVACTMLIQRVIIFAGRTSGVALAKYQVSESFTGARALSADVDDGECEFRNLNKCASRIVAIRRLYELLACISVHRMRAQPTWTPFRRENINV